MLNIPTSLTWLRIVLIPVFVGIYYVPDAWLASRDPLPACDAYLGA